MAENLYARLAEKLKVRPTPLMLEILETAAGPEEAGLLDLLPASLSQIARSLGRSISEVEPLCRKLYEKGVALKTYRKGSPGYRMHKDITMFRDATSHWVDAPKSYHDLWKRFMDEEWPGYARQEGAACPLPPGRVIPIERSIASGVRHQILDAESITKIIEKAEKLSVTNCICRVIERKCDLPLETCLQVNHSAAYMLDRGIGREITKREALELLARCEEAGLVHMTLNRSAVDHFICNCCTCCCVALPLVIKEGLSLCMPSRYQAEIDPHSCTCCGTCLDRCHFGAIEEVTGNGNAVVIHVKKDKCMGCGLCFHTCPAEAIRLMEVREAGFIPT
ncbi:MAG: 4Fe-4S ferredoxin [Desulfobacteraceae bacterium]|nr:MAG: 4Fe-4S ferredoxin [Desulfobacteraceae bacterium]